MPRIYIRNAETFTLDVYVIDTYGDPTQPLEPFELAGGAQTDRTVGDDGNGNSEISWTTQSDTNEDGHGGPMAVVEDEVYSVTAGPPLQDPKKGGRRSRKK